MRNEDFLETYGFSIEDLDTLLSEKKYRQLREKLNELNEMDVADYLQEMEKEKRLLVFRMLNKDRAAEVFTSFPYETQGEIINAINDRELKNIIEEIYVDDAVDLMEELPATVVWRVLAAATPETRKTINEFLQYPDDSAGSIMTCEYISLKKEMDVLHSFEYIRTYGMDSETIYVLFVTDMQRHLEGVVTVKDLLMNPYETVVKDIMETNIIKCTTTDDQEDVAALFNRYDLLVLPVVDKENRLVGIVTVDDIVDVMEVEATEDIEKMAAIVPTEKTYFQTSVFETWKSRIPWLMLLMISATFTGIIITSFEDALAACVVLTGFIPMLMDTAGNSGSQASVTIIRALSLGDVEPSDVLKVIWKELRVALVCGASLAAVNFLKIYIVDRSILGNTDISLAVDAVICLTLMVTVICAKLVGCCLPLIAQKIKLDPAVVASPFITTIVDAVSLLIYFTFARMLLGIG